MNIDILGDGSMQESASIINLFSVLKSLIGLGETNCGPRNKWCEGIKVRNPMNLLISSTTQPYVDFSDISIWISLAFESPC